MLINERIKSIMLSKGLSAAEFSNFVGVKRANLSHVLSGRNKPSFDFLSKILTAFPNVNASWLIIGQTREGMDNFKQNNESKDLTTLASTASDIEKVLIFYSDGSIKEHKNTKK